MGRVTPVWKLQKELEYATKRQAYLARTDKPVKTTVDARPKTIVGYRSALVKIGTANALIAVQASSAALTKFGTLASLGLVANTGTNLDDAIKEPKGFKPAQIHGIVGATSPTVATAAGSGRRYIKYNANATGNAQSSFSVPVSKVGATVTTEEQSTTAQAVATAKKADFNAGEAGYGRIWFTGEEYSTVLA